MREGRKGEGPAQRATRGRGPHGRNFGKRPALLPSPLPRAMTVTTRPTPNPDTLKFEVSGATLTTERQLVFHSAREAEGHALGEALFGVRGVADLLIFPDWVSVTRQPAADWNLLATAVENVLREHVDGAASGE